MKTVKQLREELAKFPDNALCYAYEGEVCGVIVTHPTRRYAGQGVIYCGEGTDPRNESETELLSSTVPDAGNEHGA
jgi:hypothetical protein